MEDSVGNTAIRLSQPPARSGRRWLLIGGLGLAFALTLGVGAFFGSTVGSSSAQAASSATQSQAVSSASGGADTAQQFAARPGAPGGANNAQQFAATPGAQGQCGTLTVSSVNGQTIVAKKADGSTVTILTTASTTYTQAGKSVAASTLKVGSQIRVKGTHNSDGSITATSIDILR